MSMNTPLTEQEVRAIVGQELKAAGVIFDTQGDSGQMLSVRHAADLLDISENLVRAMCLRHDRGEEGGISSIKVGGRGERRIQKSDLVQFVKSKENKRKR
jgi:hypothetical protein